MSSKTEPKDVEEVDIEVATATDATDGTTTNPAVKIRHALALGGISSILAGVTYIVGFVIFGVALRDMFEEDKLSAVESVSFLKNNEEVFYTANFLVYILNGFLQVILSCVMYTYLLSEHKQNGRQEIYFQVTSVIGIIWGALVIAAGMIGNGGGHVAVNLYETDPVRAATVWMTIDAVYTNGIGGGNEILGAVWVLMVSFSSFGCGRGFPKPVNILGLIAGIAGVITIVPGMDEATSVFGVVMTVWYILAGMWLLRAFKKTSSK
ncbi:expressed unknown protein [Seminavis robusta]|uniref:Uncharacterized protein n=1 Tax=Seminavis robusta TaxID=568900 RepID=A0A9N8DGH5_9STRA|nr:expressed unknown protein [Seminavis robusta]|eukprot:Sro76_g041590.1 n/a (265) ;mRNA; r:48807-49601